MSMFQRSVLKSVKQDEGLIASRWAEYQKYVDKIIFVENVKEEELQIKLSL